MLLGNTGSACGLLRLLRRLPSWLPQGPSTAKSSLLRPPAASVNEERRKTLRSLTPSNEDLELPADMLSLKEERRDTDLLLLLLLLSTALLTMPLLRMIVNRGDSTPVSAADNAHEASPCAPGTLLMASARIFFALLMLPRLIAKTGASAMESCVRGPSRPREEIARTMLHELLLLYALLAP
jgi:hypothetical protein